MNRYSERLAWTAPPNSFCSLLQERRSTGLPLLDLTVSNPTEALSTYPHSAIAKAYGSVSDFIYEPSPLGKQTARDQISAWYAKRGIHIPSSRLALTASTSEAYSLLFKLLINAGEEVLIPTPSYPLFEYLAQLDGVRLRSYQLLYDGSWHIDFESINRAISDRTRAVILVNPNNPTGSYLKRGEWDQLEEIAIKHCLPLIADEVFMDYPFSDSPGIVNTLISRNNALSFSLNGLSKACGMPQMKLGWIAVNGSHCECNQALQRLELLLDSYLSVATPVQNALGDLLTIGSSIHGEIRDRLQTNRKFLNTILKASGVHALHCEGGWSAVLRVPNIISEETWITRLLQEHSVIAQPGYFFDMPMDGCLLVSLLTPADVFSEGVERLIALAQSLV